MPNNYKVVVTNDREVPTYHKDVCIRPVNTHIVEKMAEITDGNLSIKGIEIVKVEKEDNK